MQPWYSMVATMHAMLALAALEIPPATGLSHEKMLIACNLSSPPGAGICYHCFIKCVVSSPFLQVAKYAAGLGPWKTSYAPWNASGFLETVNVDFVKNAHAAGLQLHPYTFRNDDRWATCSWI
jgi:hypothetical protein